MEYIRQQDKLTSDIFVFPKSISEFSPPVFSQLRQALASKPFAEDKVHILLPPQGRQLCYQILTFEKAK